MTLRFTLSEAVEVTLAIYDTAGQRLRTLFAGHLPAGLHVAAWDGRDEAGREVGSGVYLARLVAGGQVATRKLVPLR